MDPQKKNTIRDKASTLGQIHNQPPTPYTDDEGYSHCDLLSCVFGLLGISVWTLTIFVVSSSGPGYVIMAFVLTTFATALICAVVALHHVTSFRGITGLALSLAGIVWVIGYLAFVGMGRFHVAWWGQPTAIAEDELQQRTRKIQKLRKQLKSADVQTRIQALEEIGKYTVYRSDLIPDVSALLKDRDANVRLAALRELRQLELDAYDQAPAVAAALRDDLETVQREAAVVLLELDSGLVCRSFDENILPILIALLEHPDVSVRSKVAQVMGIVGGKAEKAILPLADHLLRCYTNHSAGLGASSIEKQRDIERKTVMRGLAAILSEIGANLSDRDARQVARCIAPALKDERYKTRLYAAWALYHLDRRAEPAIQALIDSLSVPSRGFGRDEGRLLRQIVSFILGDLRQRAVPPLVNSISETTPADTSKSKAENARQILAEIGAVSVPAICAELEGQLSIIQIERHRFDNKKVTRYLKVLAGFGAKAKESVGLLKRLMNSESIDCRREALKTLVAVQKDSPELVDTLILALDNPVSIVRSDALGYLIDLGAEAKKALPALQRAREDPKFKNWTNYIDKAMWKIGHGEDVLQRMLKRAKEELIVGEKEYSEAWVRRLKDIGPAAKPMLPDLLSLWKKEFTLYRDEVHDAIAEIGPNEPETIAAAIELSQYAEAGMRRRGIQMLGATNGDSAIAIATLKKALEDETNRVRIPALNALAKFCLKDKTIVNDLSQRLAQSQNLPASGYNLDFRDALLTALQQIHRTIQQDEQPAAMKFGHRMLTREEMILDESLLSDVIQFHKGKRQLEIISWIISEDASRQLFLKEVRRKTNPLIGDLQFPAFELIAQLEGDDSELVAYLLDELATNDTYDQEFYRGYGLKLLEIVETNQKHLPLLEKELAHSTGAKRAYLSYAVWRHTKSPAALRSLIGSMHQAPDCALELIAHVGPPAKQAASDLARFLDSYDKRAQLAVSALASIESLPAQAIPRLEILLPGNLTALSKIAAMKDKAAQDLVDRIAITLIRKLSGYEVGYYDRAKIEALGEVGPRAASATPILRKLLDHKEESIQHAAAIALWKISRSPDALLFLIDELDGYDRLRTAHAIRSLGPSVQVAALDILDILYRYKPQNTAEIMDYMRTFVPQPSAKLERLIRAAPTEN